MLVSGWARMLCTFRAGSVRSPLSKDALRASYLDQPKLRSSNFPISRCKSVHVPENLRSFKRVQPYRASSTAWALRGGCWSLHVRNVLWSVLFQIVPSIRHKPNACDGFHCRIHNSRRWRLQASVTGHCVSSGKYHGNVISPMYRMSGR